MICPNCGIANREGELICQKCGRLLANEGSETRLLPLTTNGLITRRVAPATDQHMLTLNAGARIFELASPQTTSILLGRSSPTPQRPNQSVLNLIEIGGDDLGVSRRHAVIQKEQGAFFVIDLDSTNGTFLNGRRLQPRSQHLLVSGDVLRLGALEVRVQIS